MIAWKMVPRTYLAAGLALMIGAGAARDEGRFDREIRAIVDDITPKLKDYLARNPGRTVSIGPFESRSDSLPARGKAIALGLKEGLKGRGIQVEEGRSGKIWITGTFLPGPDGETGEPATDITYTVKDLTVRGKEGLIVDDHTLLVDLESTIKLNGLTANTPAQATPRERRDEVIKAIEKPSVAAEKSRVRTKADSPYAMEIWVDGRPRDVSVEKGVPYVSLKAGEKIAVLLVNESKREAAVSLSIDGINSFSFQERAPGATGPPINDWTIKAGASGYIAGWYINSKMWKLFKMTEDPKEIAALMVSDDSSDVGTLTAVFKASWAVNETPPDDEPKVQAAPGGKSPEIGVGRGDAAEIDAPPRDTRFGVIRDSITIRYRKSAVPQVAAEAATTRP